MKEYEYSSNYNVPLLAELYDKKETNYKDIQLLKRLIGNKNNLNILELFSGTGRILIPLAKDGHQMTGIEMAESMILRAEDKLRKIKDEISNRVTIKHRDVMDGYWGDNYHLIVIGGNSLYELPTAEHQEQVFKFASEALNKGGKVFIDSADYKGNWANTEVGKKRIIFEGHGANGSYGLFTMEGVMYDETKDILHMKRTFFTRTKSGTETYYEYLSSMHPVSASEVENWLEKYNYKILNKFGDWEGNQYIDESSRAIFFAEKY